jgi:hypothetical protein
MLRQLPLEVDAKRILVEMLKNVAMLADYHTKWVYHEHGYDFARFDTWSPDRYIISDQLPPERWLQWANVKCVVREPRKPQVVVPPGEAANVVHMNDR